MLLNLDKSIRARYKISISEGILGSFGALGQDFV